MPTLADTIGLTIVNIRGKTDSLMGSDESIEPTHILFSDGKTFITLDEQNEYEFHDCNPNARTLTVYQDKNEWLRITTSKEYTTIPKSIKFGGR